jgi:hypothetical protein
MRWGKMHANLYGASIAMFTGREQSLEKPKALACHQKWPATNVESQDSYAAINSYE